MDETPWASRSAPYVQPSPDHPDAWAQEAAQHGGKGTQNLREVAEITPPADIARALNLQPAETAIVRRRTMLLDGRPVELADSYYPARIARHTPLAQPRKIRGGALAVLTALGHTPRQADEHVTARPPTDEERRLLQLAPGEWVLVLARTLRTDGRTPVEASIMTMIAKGRHLHYTLTL